MNRLKRNGKYVVFIPAHKNMKENEPGAIGDSIAEATGCRIVYACGLEGLDRVQFYEVGNIKNNVEVELENQTGKD